MGSPPLIGCRLSSLFETNLVLRGYANPVFCDRIVIELRLLLAGQLKKTTAKCIELERFKLIPFTILGPRKTSPDRPSLGGETRAVDERLRSTGTDCEDFREVSARTSQSAADLLYDAIGMQDARRLCPRLSMSRSSQGWGISRQDLQ